MMFTVSLRCWETKSERIILKVPLFFFVFSYKASHMEKCSFFLRQLNRHTVFQGQYLRCLWEFWGVWHTKSKVEMFSVRFCHLIKIKKKSSRLKALNTVDRAKINLLTEQVLTGSAIATKIDRSFSVLPIRTSKIKVRTGKIWIKVKNGKNSS